MYVLLIIKQYNWQVTACYWLQWVTLSFA